jgi:AbrB family looped-hinge helix DNA binding protein
MTRARLSTKGQLVIPKEMRERHGWSAGTELEVVDGGTHLLILTPTAPPTTEVEELLGCAGYSGPRRSLEEMDEAVLAEARRRR